MVTHVDVDIPQLWREYRASPCTEMRNLLVEIYLPLVKYNAERIWARLPDGVDLDDLISAGVFGLMDAIDAFDLERGVKFETYCVPRIRGAMLDELRTMDWVPRLVRSKASKMEEARKTLEASLGRPPRPDEMAARLSVSIEEFNKMLGDATAVTQVSLNKKWYETDSYKDVREIDILEDKKAEDPTHRLQNRDLMRLVTRGLNRNERLIIILYYYEDMTMKEIGATLDLSESRVSQMHSSIVARLQAGYLFIAGPILQITSSNKESFDRLKEEIRTRLALGIGDLHEKLLPAQFQNVIADALLFPAPGAAIDTTAADKVLNHAEKYYEDSWIHKPRRSLSGNTPIDAAAHPKLRKKLLGVIRFIEDCAKDGFIASYDFNRLRRKLGLLEGVADSASVGEVASPTLNVTVMGTAELAALKVESLSEDQLEQAYQTAQKLDAEDLSAHFARTLVSRPPNPKHPDHFPFYSYLTQHALKNGDKDAALDYVNEGEKADCEQNEGKRRNDYELRRGQVHVKRGEADPAADVFQRLIERMPTDLKYRGTAAEAMLSLKQPARALRFAEEGLVSARQQNNRDAEQHLMELIAAAKKQLG